MKLSEKKLRLYHIQDINRLPQLEKLSPETRLAMQAIARTLPFRANNYIVDELIDWDNIPNDPIFRLTFPQPEMLSPTDLNCMIQLLKDNAPQKVLRQTAYEIRLRLNPHPGGQKQHNVPCFDGEPIPGVQHKYQQTV